VKNYIQPSTHHSPLWGANILWHNHRTKLYGWW